jgi:LuxR family maltose regulon positive regulatory protein
VDELLIESAPDLGRFYSGAPSRHPQLDPALQAALWQALTETLARAQVRLPVASLPILMPAPTRTARPVHVPLSAREEQVLKCIAAGDSNKLIARTLGLSLHTVKRHVANILDKLDAGSRGQAAAWWQARR